ncbi:MAG: M16 family metallopeptidase [Synechococcus sp.]
MIDWRNRIRRSFLWVLAVVWIAFGSGISPAIARTAEAPLPQAEHRLELPSLEIPSLTEGVEKLVLPNGLTVLLKEVHTAPVVALQLWYRVGSADETLGNNGISHQLEHLLFKGTRDRPIQFGRLFDAVGSSFNAFTTYDATGYFHTVSRDRLDTILELEADRMVNTLIAPEAVDSEKRVVISELQGYENSPSYRLNRAVRRTLYASPKDTSTAAYSLPVGGTRADVEQFQPEQIQAYYRQYYAPDNAVLAIVGDFERHSTVASVRKTFGNIRPSGRAATQAEPAIAQPLPPTDPVRLEEPGSLPLLVQMYPLPYADHSDVPALDLLSSILSGGRSGRFYQDIIRPQIANSVSSSTTNLRGAGWLQVSATLGNGQDFDSVETAISAEFQKLQDSLVDVADLERVKRQLLAGVILGYRDISSQARQLAGDETTSGDYRYSDRYLQQAAAVTPADIQAVARKYLRPDLCHRGYFTPTSFDPNSVGTEVREETTGTDSVALVASNGTEDIQQYLPADAARAPDLDGDRLRYPREVVYPSGLKLLLLPDDSAPAVTLVGNVEAGSGFDTPERAGVASFTAGLLTSGTTTQTGDEFAARLENVGAGLAFAARREGVSFGGAALARDLPLLAEQLADALRNPTFPTDELELTRHRSLARLQASLDNPSSVATRTFQQSLFPEGHPYHAMSSLDSLQAIQQQEIVEFYRAHYRPDTTTIALVGDFDSAEVESLFAELLGDWSAAGEPPYLDFPKIENPATISRQYKSLEGKTQSVTYLGHMGINRFDPDFEAAVILNDIIGGSTLSSRLGLEVRDRQGLTYGISSAFQTGKGVGPFVVRMQTDPTDVQQAVDSTLAVLKQVKENGVTPIEFEQSRDSFINSYPVSLADPDAVGRAFLRREVLGLPLQEMYEFPEKVKALKLEDVNRVAAQLLQPDVVQIVTAGP